MKRHTRKSRPLQDLKGTIQLIQFQNTAGLFIWTVPMEVLGVGDSYGHARLLVRPVNGTGEGWVDAGRLIIQGEEFTK